MAIDNDNRPTVFLSSTVLDFADLRSALRFYLEHSGYRVLLSESSQFPVDPTKSNYDICLDAVDQCEIYVLLIGTRRGSSFGPDGSTITQAEYRRARERLDRGDNMRLVTFVRRETWIIAHETESTVATSSILEDAQYTRRFLDEVARSQETTQALSSGDSLPSGVWLWQFSTFDDIVTSLDAILRLNTNRQREILIGQALSQLDVIIRACFEDYTASGDVWPNFIPLLPVIEARSLRGISLSKDVAVHAGVLGTFGWKLLWLQTDALNRLRSSGELMAYNLESRVYESTTIERLLQILLFEIERVQTYFRGESLDNWFRRLEEIEKAANVVTMDDDPVELPVDVAFHLWMNGRTSRIFYNAQVLQAALKKSNPIAWVETIDLESGALDFVSVGGQSLLNPPPREKVDRWFEQQVRQAQTSS